jgi:hypothetical protein
MKLRYLLAGALLGGVLALTATMALGARGGNRPHNPGTLFGVMLGKKEISTTTGRRGAGDLNGRGGATAVIKGDQFCWGIVVKNLDTPVAAHVHRARRNKNGPIVIPLAAPANGSAGAASGCETIARDLARKIARHPGRYYFNVHTTAFPNGAIRGQIFGTRR